MRRILSLTLVAVMLLSTLMLVSCDAVIDLLGGIFGDEVRTTITEVEWQKTLLLDNYTVTANSDTNSDTNLEVLRAGSAQSFKMSYNGQSLNYLADTQKGIAFIETPIGWTATEVEGGDLLGNTNVSLSALFEGLKYEDLVYDYATKSYTGKTEQFIAELHFEDGVLTYAMLLSLESTEVGMLEIKDVGKTVVNLPTSYTNVSDGKADPNTADKTVRTDITESEWAVFASMTNYTVIGAFGINSTTLKATDEGISQVMSYNLGDEERMEVIIDGYFYHLEKGYDGKYIATKSTVADTTPISVVFGDNVTFEDLVYDENARYYYATIGDGRYTMYLYFENGMITKAVQIMSDNTEVIILFSNIGTTKVDFPEYTINIDTQVDEFQWIQNVNYTNYTIKAVSGEATGTIMQSGNVCRMFEQMNGEEDTYYYVEQDGTVYYVTNQDGEWQGKKDRYMDTMMPWPFQIMAAKELRYDDFAYDSELQAYVMIQDGIRVELYFINDVIDSAVITATIDEEYINMVFEFSDLGTTPEIEVPEFTIVDTDRS